MTQSNVREIKVEGNEDRASRMARRTEREQREKRRARDGRDDRSSATPGASAVTHNTASSSADRTERMRSRAEEEREAKRRARDGGSRHHHHHHNSRSTKSRSPHRSRNARRSQEEADAKRRARSGTSSSTATPGVQSYSTNSTPVPNENEALEIQAELVSEDEQISDMKKKMMDENERLRQQMVEQNEIMRRQMENDNAALRNQMNDDREQTSNGDDDNKQFPTKYKIAILIAIIAIAGGVGVFLGTRGSPSTAPVVITAPSTEPTAPTMPPTILATPVPTTAPTQEQTYPKPSPQDCLRVKKGEAIQGQNSLQSKRFGVSTDVSLAPATGVDTMLEALQVETQNLLVPILVGCNERRRRLQARQFSSQKNRYAIANAEVVSVTHDESQTCVPQGDGPCYRVVTTLDLFLKEDSFSNVANDFVLQNLIIGAYDVETLAADLGINSLIDFISFKNVFPVQVAEPTNPPTTAIPVSNPTLPPVSTPTTPPTPPPTSTPAPPPTKAPTAPIDCGPNCEGEDACLEASQSTIGCGSCTASRACEAVNDVEIGEGSCKGMDSCAALLEVIIGSNSCIEKNSCACLAPGTVIGDDECQAEGQCCGMNGAPKNVPTSSCGPRGAQSCRGASGPIGPDSCNGGTKTCFRSKAEIGAESCNEGGCVGTFGEINDNACNGNQACPMETYMTISDNSCNCERCCACLEGTENLVIPPNSCNSLAPSQGLKDFVSGEAGPFNHCCG